MIFYSPIESVYYLLPVIGFVVGFFGTLLGGGGGFVFLPILVLFYNTPTHTAVITSLVATLPIGLLGAVGHYKKGHTDLQLARLFSWVGVIGAIAGVVIAQKISGKGLKTVFGIYCLFMGGVIWNSNRRDKKQEPGEGRGAGKWERGNFKNVLMYGLPAGMVTGALGTSGTAPILAGLMSMNIPLKKVVGTAIIVVSVNTLFAIGAYFLMGRIDMTLVLMLTTGSLIGAVLGPRVLSHMEVQRSEKKIKYIYGAAMVVLGIVMISSQ